MKIAIKDNTDSKYIKLQADYRACDGGARIGLVFWTKTDEFDLSWLVETSHGERPKLIVFVCGQKEVVVEITYQAETSDEAKRLLGEVFIDESEFHKGYVSWLLWNENADESTFVSERINMPPDSA